MRRPLVVELDEVGVMIDPCSCMSLGRSLVS